MGYNTLTVNRGNCNVAIGDESLVKNTTGYNNVSIGHISQWSNVSGNFNTSVGSDLLANNSTGSFNSCFGYGAGNSIFSTNGNTCIGQLSDVLNNSSNSTAIGYYAKCDKSNQIMLGTKNESVYIPGDYCYIGTTANENNLKVYGSTYTGDLFVSNDCDIGNYDITTRFLVHSVSIFEKTVQFKGEITLNNFIFQDIGNLNTQFGTDSLQNNTLGARNTAFGVASLKNNTEGLCNSAFGVNSLSLNTTGNNNTSTGHHSLLINTTGFQNTCMGVNALLNNQGGYYNTCLGFGAGNTITNNNSNTCIGFDTDILNNASNSTAIGYNAKCYASNQIVIGTSNESIDIHGSFFFHKSINNISSTVFNYLYGVTSNVQNQLNLLFSLTPPGTIIINVSTQSTLSQYLYCDGSEYLKSQYSNLYNAIGDQYGVPTDNTKFKVPNFQGVFLRGYGNQNVFGKDYSGGYMGEIKADEIKQQNISLVAGIYNRSDIEVILATDFNLGQARVKVINNFDVTYENGLGLGTETVPVHAPVKYFIKY